MEMLAFQKMELMTVSLQRVTRQPKHSNGSKGTFNICNAICSASTQVIIAVIVLVIILVLCRFGMQLDCCTVVIASPVQKSGDALK
jgi:hypothetical protein